MVFFAYLSSGNDTNSIADVVAKKLAQTFLFVNFVDGIFWTYGLKGLKIQIGDTIHEEAFGIRERDDRNDICWYYYFLRFLTIIYHRTQFHPNFTD